MNDERAALLQSGADQCVKCGLCLPHCPTYQLSRDEAESPRGRIALMQGLATGALAPERVLVRHIDQCLACRACETVCPARVPYGAMLDAARAEIAASTRRPLREGLIGRTLARPWLLGTAARLARLAQRLGTLRILRRGGTLASLGAMLPPAAGGAIRRRSPDADVAQRRRVALFEPCINREFEPGDLSAATVLLAAAGFGVDPLPGGRCCGALLQHYGRLDEAATLARTNIDALDRSRHEALVAIASGCTQGLRDYPSLLPGATSDAFAMRVIDIHEILADAGMDQAHRYRRCDARIAVHTPCTLANDRPAAQAMLRLLSALPGVRLTPLSAHFGCCGAAGTHMLTHRERAAAFVAPIVDQIEALGADIVVSANVGCLWHLRSALHRRGIEAEALHPIRLLARQLS